MRIHSSEIKKCDVKKKRKIEHHQEIVEFL